MPLLASVQGQGPFSPRTGPCNRPARSDPGSEELGPADTLPAGHTTRRTPSVSSEAATEDSSGREGLGKRLLWPQQHPAS